MEWKDQPERGVRMAHGRDQAYLMTLSRDSGGGVSAVILTRWPSPSPSPVAAAARAARNAIRFPFGRGPGRPGGVADSEVEAMYALAIGYAEQYERGEDLAGYPEWTYRRPYPGFPARYPSGADTHLTQDGELGDDAAFEIAYRPGNANDCRHC